MALLLVLGCASPLLISAPLPTPSPDAAALQIIIAQTAAAAQSGTILAIPPTSTFTLTPSPTRIPTQTFTASPTFIFTFKTSTSFADATASAQYAEEDAQLSMATSDVPTPHPWACKVISRLPDIGGSVKHGQRFYAQWLVENTGTKVWPVQGVDVVFYTGGRFHDRPYYDIPATVPPGGRVTIIVPLTAPGRLDTFSTTWALKVGKRAFCALKLTFTTY
ncbi:MAG: hypothetical protein Fur0043_17710 [Anaerolineales bacterium]